MIRKRSIFILFYRKKNVYFSLPSIEFQPEIITNNDGSVSKLKCELYSGSICRSILGSQYISIINQNQQDIEQNLMENLKFLTNNQFLSNECRQLLLPMVCLFTYPLCDNDQINIRSICRRSCSYFQNTACPNLFSYAQQRYSNCKCDNKKKGNMLYVFFFSTNFTKYTDM